MPPDVPRSPRDAHRGPCRPPHLSKTRIRALPKMRGRGPRDLSGLCPRRAFGLCPRCAAQGLETYPGCALDAHSGSAQDGLRLGPALRGLHFGPRRNAYLPRKNHTFDVANATLSMKSLLFVVGLRDSQRERTAAAAAPRLNRRDGPRPGTSKLGRGRCRFDEVSAVVVRGAHGRRTW